jgi:hypothetical protein
MREREVGGFASPPILAVVKKKKKDGFLKCLVSFETKNEIGVCHRRNKLRKIFRNRKVMRKEGFEMEKMNKQMRTKVWGIAFHVGKLFFFPIMLIKKVLM